jgi:hypothetical protein
MPAMTSDQPSGEAPQPDGEPPHPDADDWWGGTVDPPPPADPPANPPGTPPTGGESEGGAGGDGGAVESSVAVQTGNGRSRWLLGAAALAAVAAIGVGVLVTRDDGSTPAATAAESNANGFPPGGQGPGGFGGGTGGTISEIDADASTLVVKTSDGDSVEVTANDDTTISETVEGSVDDLAVDDNVVVVGSAGDDGTIAADTIVAGGDGGLLGRGGPGGDGQRPQAPEGGFPEGGFPGGGTPPDRFDPYQGGGPGGFTSGTVASIDDGTLTVTTADGETVKVTVSSDTTVQVQHELSFDDLATGDEVTVIGQSGDDGSVDAVTIRKGDGGFGFGGGGFPGGGNGGSDGTGSDTGDAGDGSTT